MNLRHLIFFRELAKTQHMAKAAENLGISQPSLSYAIKKLEVELGIPLFEPDGRNIKLTPLGETFLKYVNEGLSSISDGQKLVKELVNPNTGEVRLGFTYTLGQRLVPEIMTQFKQSPGNQNISFQLGQDNTTNLINALDAEKYDVIFSSHVAHFDDTGAENRFNFQPLVKQEIKVALPTNHPLATKQSLLLADLRNYPLIIYSQNSGLRPLISRILAHATFKPNIAYELEEDHTITGFVQYGLGIALVPGLPQLDQTKVVLKHLDDVHEMHKLYLVTKNNHFITPSVQRFIKFSLAYTRTNFADKERTI